MPYVKPMYSRGSLDNDRPRLPMMVAETIHWEELNDMVNAVMDAQMLWLLALYLTLPALAIFACYKVAAVRKIGIVLICYGTGILLGALGWLPDGAAQLQEKMADVSVALALPLLLFSMDVRKWFSLAGKAVLSMAAACVAAMVMSIVGAMVVQGFFSDSWQVGGMAAGVYTGGTPNVAAIKSALGVDTETFLIFHAYDTIISIVYIIFCMTFAQRLFGRWLLPFAKAHRDIQTGREEEKDMPTEDIYAFRELLRPGNWPMLGALGLLSAGIVGLALLVSGLFSAHAASATAIVTITTLGIAASFIPPVRDNKHVFQLGMYIIYVFCCVVGSMVNATALTNIHFPILFVVFLVIYGGMALHAVFCRILRVDTDTFIITSVSAICSPPFVPPVAAALNNKHMLLSGITTGIIGYAVGNYLGIFTAYLLRYLFS